MTKIIMTLFMGILLNSMVGGAFAAVTGVDAGLSILGANALSMLSGTGAGTLRAGVLTEVWTGELIKSLRAGLEATWLDGIPDQSALAENDVIHLVDVGVDPDVLVNYTMTSDGIALQALDDTDKTLNLDKFQTKVTPVTDDELYALSYDKMQRVKESHANAINDAKFQRAAWNLCPANNTDNNVIETSGDYEDGESGRKRLTRDDIIKLKAIFDKNKVPTQGRRLVLCSDHVNDLLLLDQKFADQYYNYTTGKIANLYGFEVYEFANNPIYTTAGVKVAYGTAASTGQYQVSFAFFTQRVFKATGTTKMYFSEAGNDPQFQRNLINFRHMFICAPKKADACGVIRSGYTA
ncbi:MAG: hypothetical protein K6E86_02100 [Bacteroidales bacterium]|nr:hypothetical protein [Bacteroidales bacterium]